MLFTRARTIAPYGRIYRVKGRTKVAPNSPANKGIAGAVIYD